MCEMSCMPTRNTADLIDELYSQIRPYASSERKRLRADNTPAISQTLVSAAVSETPEFR